MRAANTAVRDIEEESQENQKRDKALHKIFYYHFENRMSKKFMDFFRRVKFGLMRQYPLRI